MSDDEGHSEDEEDSDTEDGQLVGSGVKHQADVCRWPSSPEASGFL